MLYQSWSRLAVQVCTRICVSYMYKFVADVIIVKLLCILSLYYYGYMYIIYMYIRLVVSLL